MTVRVVSDKPLKTKKVMCTKCSYELEYTGEDVQWKSGYDDAPIYWIECPRGSCKEKVYVKAWSSSG